MICVRLDGGLGNQLFQYAAGRALASRLGTELLLDTSTLLRHTRNVTPRHFELNRFRLTARVATRSESRFFPWLHHIGPLSYWVSPWHTFVEKNVGCDHHFQNLADNTFLVGYWQSFKYFSNIALELSNELVPSEPLSRVSQLIADKIEASTAVAIHIRRGDYVSRAEAASHHGVLPLSYYHAALNRVNDQVRSPRYFVFSDDPDWCRSSLPLYRENSVFVDHNVGSNAWQDLVLMGRCHHHVIANSSFSWWGAWLGDQRCPGSQRLVVAPVRWFGGRDLQNLGDRLPSHWMVQE